MSDLLDELKKASVVEFWGERFIATESLGMRLALALGAGRDRLAIVTSDDDTSPTKMVLDGGRMKELACLVSEALERMETLQAEIDQLSTARVPDSPEKSITDHALFETEDVIDVELPEALKKYAEPGETPEETKARLSERWFDLNQRFIALSRGEQWPERLTEAEHKLMNELSIFARG